MTSADPGVVPPDWWKTTLEPVAETHFMIRHVLLKGLREQKLTDDGRKLVGTYETYADFWQASLGHHFFDMGTMIRLGTAIETSLRDYYCTKRMLTLTQLPGSNRGIFQRLEGQNSVTDLYNTDLGYDLTTNPEFTTMREAMLHRHLYAHRAGIVDDKYINGLKSVTGEDIRPSVVARGYPNSDVYWFKSLDRLPELIEATRRFFRHFPP